MKVGAYFVDHDNAGGLLHVDPLDGIACDDVGGGGDDGLVAGAQVRRPRLL